MKRIIFIILVVSITLPLFSASAELEIYTRLYESADTQVEKLGILREIRDAKISDAPDFYAAALDRLLTGYPDVRGSLQIQAADDTARLLSGLLGEAQYGAAAGNLWRVVETFSNPLVRADALIALGKVGGRAFIPQIIQLLSDLNINPTTDRLAGEQVAFGAVAALRDLKDPLGYLPVFFTASGWYSDRVRNQASSALPQILDNPTEPLLSVIQGSGYTYPVKLYALQTMDQSNASNPEKASAAVAAYTEGWRAATNQVSQRMNLAVIRKLSIKMIERLGTDDTAVYPLLERSYKTGIDPEEQLSAIAALAALATDDSARRLSSFIQDINDKHQRGSKTVADERLIRALIPALGATGKAIGRPILRSILAIDWTNAVKNLATEALGKIPN
jgi:HEAT repeat protein